MDYKEYFKNLKNMRMSFHEKLQTILDTRLRECLYETNDGITRNKLKTDILGDLQATAILAPRCLVVCDETINTPQITDQNKLVCKIIFEDEYSDLHEIVGEIEPNKLDVDQSKI